MEAIPKDVIECAILDGQMPQYGDGAEWCEQHDSCYRCAKDIHDMMGEEIRRLKAERDEYLESCRLWEFKCKSMVELPRDADGELIHVRDMMDGYNKTIEVVELRYGRSGWVLISRDGNAYADTHAFTHHRKPTVESVLRQFLGECESAANLGYDEVPQEVFDDYAAKLRLVGDAE